MDINLDLFIVGIIAAAIGILGFVVFINNKKSVTHKIFFTESIVTVIYIFVNYSAYKFLSADIVLILLRLVLFISLWHAFFMFYLFYVFPNEKMERPLWFDKILLPAMFAVSVVVLSPLAFVSIETEIVPGKIALATPGPGLVFFGIMVIGLVIAGISLLLKKLTAAHDQQKKQFRLMFIGTLVTYLSLIVFNYIFPALFDNGYFVPFAPLFVAPFIAFSAYAIMRHGLLNVKILSSEILVFFLCVATLVQIFFSIGTLELIFRMSIFFLVVIFGLRLIQSAQQEVEQRQKIEQIAKDLAEANEHLRELDKEKSEFVSIASHQLRTPLTAIRGYASMLLEGSYGGLPEKAIGVVDRINQSTVRLVMIIEDFLDITKIEQGKMTYQFVTVDMKGLVRGLVEEMEPSARQKNLEFILKMDDEGSFKATADFGKIRQVLSNLLDNAIKYNQMGKIYVNLSKDSVRGRIQVSVHDTGIGISPQTMEKLFQKFSRAEGVKKIYTEGSGLGLYVAQEMIKAHHGRIWAESEGEGKGSTFYVELMAED
jgi:signal transduction histidine kinase